MEKYEATLVAIIPIVIGVMMTALSDATSLKPCSSTTRAAEVARKGMTVATQDLAFSTA